MAPGPDADFVVVEKLRRIRNSGTIGLLFLFVVYGTDDAPR